MTQKTQRPGEGAAIAVALVAMRSDPGAWYDALPRAVSAAYPTIRAAVLAELLEEAERSEQKAAAVFVGRMITKEQGDA